MVFHPEPELLEFADPTDRDVIAPAIKNSEIGLKWNVNDSLLRSSRNSTAAQLNQKYMAPYLYLVLLNKKDEPLISRSSDGNCLPYNGKCLKLWILLIKSKQEAYWVNETAFLEPDGKVLARNTFACAVEKSKSRGRLSEMPQRHY